MADTEIEKFTFTVKEGVSGAPFIALEPLYRNFPSLEGSLLTLNLPNGTSIEKAEEIAKYLDDNIDSVGFTRW
jgi:hypothetical protein